MKGAVFTALGIAFYSVISQLRDGPVQSDCHLAGCCRGRVTFLLSFSVTVLIKRTSVSDKKMESRREIMDAVQRDLGSREYSCVIVEVKIA
jgi:hypothetical protein